MRNVIFIICTLISMLGCNQEKGNNSALLGLLGINTSSSGNTSSNSNRSNLNSDGSSSNPSGHQNGSTNVSLGLPEIQYAYQINLSLIDMVGVFYHQSKSFPQVWEITDMDTVKLSPDLETPNQDLRDFNLFILDGQIGSILYSFNNSSAGALQSKNLIGAQKIAVSSNGQILVIDKNGKLNLCFRFDGMHVVESLNCNSNGQSARLIAARGYDQFLFTDLVGNAYNMDVLGNVQKLIFPELVTITSVDVVGNELLIIDNYKDFIDFTDMGIGASPRYVLKGKVKNYSGNSGKAHYFGAIKDEAGRYYIGSTGALNGVVGVDSNFEIMGFFPLNSMPLPYWPLNNLRGISMYSHSNVLHVFNDRSIQAIKLDSGSRITQLHKYVPPAMLPVVTVAIQNMLDPSFDINTDDPTSDLNFLKQLKNSIASLSLGD